MIKKMLQGIWAWLKTAPKTLWKLVKWTFATLFKKYESEKQEQKPEIAFKAMKAFVYICVGILIVYFAILMLLRGPSLSAEVYSQQNRTFTQSATRGNIYDTNGKILAATIESCTICVSRTTIKEYAESSKYTGDLEDYRRLIATKLATTLGLDYEATLSRLSGEGNYWNVATDVSLEIGDELKKWISDEKIKGVTVEADTSRYYPYGSYAAHVIGFTGIDDHGLACGLEVELDDELSGTDGQIIATVEKNGNIIPGYDATVIEQKVDGYNANLTIDINLQKIAEDALKDAVTDFGAIEGGCVIIMDPDNADVLAMASNPSFDLNDPYANVEALESNYYWREGEDYKTKLAAITDEEERENFLKENSEPNILSSLAWRNKGISISYEPGSTFKAVTAAIALEEGVVTPDTVIDDSDLPLDKYNEWIVHCSTQEGGHGHEIFRYGVANSCNPVMARVAKMVGTETFYKYVRAFGFRNKTNILLSGEMVGDIHTNPTEIDLACAAFGQRFTITPIQLATAYCALANGGTLYEPRLVKSLTDANGNVVKTYESKEIRQVISENTSATVMDLLEGVVREGTAGNAYIAGYRMAGKTGTAETVTSDIDGRYIVSFAGVAPSDNPKYVVLVILDHATIGEATGAKMGTRLCAEIMKKALSYAGVSRVYSQSDLKAITNVYYPVDVTGQTVGIARMRIKTKSGRMYNIEIVGNGDTVVRQYPLATDYMAREGTIVLYTEDDPELKAEMVKMPDVTGLGIGEAWAALTEIGLNLDTRSIGKVTAQSIEPGTLVEKGTIITLTIEKGE